MRCVKWEPIAGGSSNPHRWMEHRTSCSADVADGATAAAGPSPFPSAVAAPTLSGESSSVLSAQKLGLRRACTPAPACRTCTSRRMHCKVFSGPWDRFATVAFCPLRNADISGPRCCRRSHPSSAGPPSYRCLNEKTPKTWCCSERGRPVERTNCMGAHDSAYSSPCPELILAG